MKKIVSIMLVFSVALMSFATTFAQSGSFRAYGSDALEDNPALLGLGNNPETDMLEFGALPFGTELSESELAQIDGEGGENYVAAAIGVATSIVGNVIYDAAKRTAKAGKERQDKKNAECRASGKTPSNGQGGFKCR